jgi:O-antigen ligase
MTIWNKIAFTLISVIVTFTTLAYGAVHQPIIALFYILTILSLMAWAADSFSSSTLRFSRSRLQIPLLLLSIYSFVQIIPFGSYADAAGIAGIPRTISVDPFSTQVTAVHMLLLSVFFAVALYCLDSAARLRRIVTILTGFGFLYAFYAILQSVLSPDKIFGIYDPQTATPFGSFVNRHNFAAVIEMLIALPIGMLLTGSVRPDKRLLYIVAVALMGSSLLLSGSRGGLVALIAEILLAIIITTRSHGRKNLALKVALSLMLVVSAVGGAIFVGGDTSLTRFADTAASEDISSSRTQIWSVTLKVISEHLPFGAGVGAFPQAYTKFDTASGYERVEQAHNDYLQVLADAGVAGLVIGALFLFWFFQEGMRNSKSENKFRRGIAVGAFAGCFGILIHSAFDFVLHITAISVMFLTMMAILVASGRTYDDDITDFEDGSNKRRRKKASVTPITEKG